MRLKCLGDGCEKRGAYRSGYCPSHKPIFRCPRCLKPKASVRAKHSHYCSPCVHSMDKGKFTELRAA